MLTMKDFNFVLLFRRRGVGHPDQGDHRWWWCYPPHPQVSDRQEGRGCARPVEPTRAPSIMII